MIGEIEYESYGYGQRTSTDEINSRYNGRITFISTAKDIQDEEIVAKIESYDIVENEDY